MSEYTEDVLDGLFCECCGEFMENAVGYPRKCSACGGESNDDDDDDDDEGMPVKRPSRRAERIGKAALKAKGESWRISERVGRRKTAHGLC